MTLDETKRILQRISIAYPYYFNNKTYDEKVSILKNWNSVLNNLSFDEVNSRLDKHILNSKYAPSISELTSNTTSGSKFNNYNQSTTFSDQDMKILQHNIKKFGKYLTSDTEPHIE